VSLRRLCNNRVVKEFYWIRQGNRGIIELSTERCGTSRDLCAQAIAWALCYKVSNCRPWSSSRQRTARCWRSLPDEQNAGTGRWGKVRGELLCCRERCQLNDVNART
jgi:hypothetical protein